MKCPNCLNEISRLKALDKANSDRLDGYVCVECNAHIRDKGWPKPVRKKLIYSYLALGIVAIPLTTYLEAICHKYSSVIGLSALSLFFLLPVIIKPKELPWFSYELFK